MKKSSKNVNDNSGSKMASTDGGIDLKSGFKSTKPVIDGFKGQPAKINKKQEYTSSDASQLAEYKLKGYKTKVSSDE